MAAFVVPGFFERLFRMRYLPGDRPAALPGGVTVGTMHRVGTGGAAGGEHEDQNRREEIHPVHVFPAFGIASSRHPTLCSRPRIITSGAPRRFDLLAGRFCIYFKGLVIVGTWRSLVAHLLWEQRVAGSNPVVPTILFRYLSMLPDSPERGVRSFFRRSDCDIS